MRIIWRALERWPVTRKATPADERSSGQAFKAKYDTIMSDFESELQWIDARDPVVSIDMDPRMLRRSGEPYASAQTLSTPGIVLHFTDKDGRDVSFACDKYRTWLGNLRGISLTLTALRSVDRYGATAGEQYRGFTAIPAYTTPTLSTQQAAELLATWSGTTEGKLAETAESIKTSRTAADKAFKIARKRSHPDNEATGGSNQKFTLVSEAGRILAAHHGVEKL